MNQLLNPIMIDPTRDNRVRCAGGAKTRAHPVASISRNRCKSTLFHPV